MTMTVMGRADADVSTVRNPYEVALLEALALVRGGSATGGREGSGSIRACSLGRVTSSSACTGDKYRAPTCEGDAANDNDSTGGSGSADGIDGTTTDEEVLCRRVRRMQVQHPQEPRPSAVAAGSSTEDSSVPVPGGGVGDGTSPTAAPPRHFRHASGGGGNVLNSSFHTALTCSSTRDEDDDEEEYGEGDEAPPILLSRRDDDDSESGADGDDSFLFGNGNGGHDDDEEEEEDDDDVIPLLAGDSVGGGEGGVTGAAGVKVRLEELLLAMLRRARSLEGRRRGGTDEDDEDDGEEEEGEGPVAAAIVRLLFADGSSTTTGSNGGDGGGRGSSPSLDEGRDWRMVYEYQPDVDGDGEEEEEEDVLVDVDGADVDVVYGQVMCGHAETGEDEDDGYGHRRTDDDEDVLDKFQFRRGDDLRRHGVSSDSSTGSSSSSSSDSSSSSSSSSSSASNRGSEERRIGSGRDDVDGGGDVDVAAIDASQFVDARARRGSPRPGTPEAGTTSSPPVSRPYERLDRVGSTGSVLGPLSGSVGGTTGVVLEPSDESDEDDDASGVFDRRGLSGSAGEEDGDEDGDAEAIVRGRGLRIDTNNEYGGGGGDDDSSDTGSDSSSDDDAVVGRCGSDRMLSFDADDDGGGDQSIDALLGAPLSAVRSPRGPAHVALDADDGDGDGVGGIAMRGREEEEEEGERHSNGNDEENDRSAAEATSMATIDPDEVLMRALCGHLLPKSTSGTTDLRRRRDGDEDIEGVDSPSRATSTPTTPDDLFERLDLAGVPYDDGTDEDYAIVRLNASRLRRVEVLFERAAQAPVAAAAEEEEEGSQGESESESESESEGSDRVSDGGMDSDSGGGDAVGAAAPDSSVASRPIPPAVEDDEPTDEGEFKGNGSEHASDRGRGSPPRGDDAKATDIHGIFDREEDSEGEGETFGRSGGREVEDDEDSFEEDLRAAEQVLKDKMEGLEAGEDGENGTEGGVLQTNGFAACLYESTGKGRNPFTWSDRGYGNGSDEDDAADRTSSSSSSSSSDGDGDGVDRDCGWLVEEGGDQHDSDPEPLPLPRPLQTAPNEDAEIGPDAELSPSGSDGSLCAQGEEDSGWVRFDLPVVYKPNKTGFEPSKDIVLSSGDIVAGRYQVQGVLGSAAFSTAYRCTDLSADDQEDNQVCLKVIKNTKDYFDQSLDEIKILDMLRKQGDSKGGSGENACKANNLLEMKSYFYYREHLIIVTELLKQNLYEFDKFIRENDEPRFFTRERLCYITRQVLVALEYIHEMGLVHCDVKPENILVSSYSRARVKLIDFGSTCFTTDSLSSYIQSRAYRAPEVVLGLPYDGKIDLWSLGCVIAEMYTGTVIFENDSVVSMLAKIEATCGAFPRWMIEQGRQSNAFFMPSGLLYDVVDDEVDERDGTRMNAGGEVMYNIFRPVMTTVAERLGFDADITRRNSLTVVEEERAMFANFLQSLLTIDPASRPSASEALRHPWILSGLASLTEEDIRYPSEA